ncbi:hypothetical protein EXIGLDRAFT_766154 [Exidia glandulosa HHB12029]|uniref:Uncharacterized protein n=1 Tax=Exidia glandulosa HHB12029 TaxID=1314781 RepID=A0A165JX51_EXIGL|nr:hypothetical protein EXIGLDRAFT_766154 [Exidia glandulosa HHB12029]
MRHATLLSLKKYAAFFEVNVPSYSDEVPYGAVRAFALARKRQIFLAIDNYTTPFLDMRIKAYCRDDSIIAFRRLEDAIYAHMLAHIFVDASIGLVKRGFITGLLQPGEELGSPVPFADYAPIEIRTEDLTHSSLSSGIVEFTKNDVTELVRSFLCVQESAIPGVVNVIIDNQYCTTDTTLFAPRNIIEALREYEANVPNVASPSRSEDSTLLQHSLAALKL